VAALAALAEPLAAAAAAAAVARVTPVVLGALLPYARPGPGLGRAVGGRVHAALAIAVAALLCWAMHEPWLALVPPAAIVPLALGARAWLGGVTGDVLGAAAELTELAALVTAVALA
jgi:adenosylcobinamide-GDP ribazoletransferase